MAEEILDSMDEIEASGDAEKTVGIENLKVLENIDVELTVEVGRTEITIRELLRLNEGSVVELDRLAGDPLDILVNNTKIAKGEVVMIGERFGVRFGEIVDPEKRMEMAGPKDRQRKKISHLTAVIRNKHCVCVVVI